MFLPSVPGAGVIFRECVIVSVCRDSGGKVKVAGRMGKMRKECIFSSKEIRFRKYEK